MNYRAQFFHDCRDRRHACCRCSLIVIQTLWTVNSWLSVPVNHRRRAGIQIILVHCEAWEWSTIRAQRKPLRFLFYF